MTSHDFKIKNDYEILVDSMPGIAVLADTNGIILALNENFAKILGDKKEKIIGSCSYNYLEKSIGKSRSKIIKKVVKTKKPIQFEDFERNRWWSTNVIPLFNDEGDVEKVVGIIYDITEDKLDKKKQIDKKINYYSSLINYAYDLIVVFDKNGNVIFENPAIERCLGYKKSERIGNHISDLFLKEDKSTINKFLEDFIDSGENSKKQVIRLKHKNGSATYFEAIIQNLLEDMDINGFVVNARNISETKEMMQLLKESEGKYHTVFDKTTEGIIIKDNKGVITDVNNATLKILGYSKFEELIGKPSSIIYANPNTRKNVMDLILKNGFVNSYKMISKKKNGTIIHTIGSATLIKDIDGKPSKIIGIFNDISELEENRLKLAEKMRYLDNIINNTNEIIFAIDNNKKITLWNDSTESFSGYKSWKVLNKKITDFDLIDNKKDFLDFIDSSFNEKYRYFDHLEIRTKMNEKKLLKISPSILKN